MLPTVLCLAPTSALAEQIIARLKADGIPGPDISVVGVPRDEATPLEPVGGYQLPSAAASAGGTAAGAFAAAGAALAALLIPGAQAFLLAPVLLTAGAAVGVGAAASSAASSLADYELPQVYRDHYLGRLQRGGGYLILVRTEDEATLDRAERACGAGGGQDVARVQFTRRLT